MMSLMERNGTRHPPILQMVVPRKGPAGVLTPRWSEWLPPGHGEVQVGIEAVGVAYADVVVRRGLYRGVSLPVVPGYDLVGRVRAVGPGVSGWTLGQRVAAVTVVGAYASHLNVDARWLVPAPEAVPAETLVAAVLNGLTAWQMLHRVARAQPGETVLVHGAAGGVGGLLVDLAKLAGLRVIGTVSSHKVDSVVSKGALAVAHDSDNVLGQIRSLAQDGVSAAFDHLGGSHLRRITLPALGPLGIAVMYGAYDVTRGGRMNPLALADLLLNSKVSSFALFGQSQGLAGYSAPVWRERRIEMYRADLQQVLQRVAEGTLVPQVGKVFALEEAANAQMALESRSVVGKVVLVNRGAA